MKIAIAAVAGLLLSASAALGQDDERARRILERIEKVLEKSHAQLIEDIERIVREEIRRARAAKPPEAPRRNPADEAVPGAGKRAYLGITAGDLSDEERKALGVAGGIRVAEVRGPAEKAGLKPGDILLSLGGDPVTEDTIGRLLERRRPGDAVDVVVLRERKRESLKVVLGERTD